MPTKSYQIIIKPEAFDNICSIHGWSQAQLKRMADELGYTRQYVFQFVRGIDSLSGDGIGKIVRGLCGIRGDNWSHLFDIRQIEKKNFQCENMDKFNRVKPYNRNSLAVYYRYRGEKNIPVEQKSVDSFQTNL